MESEQPTDAVEFAREALAADLRRARALAGLSAAELAERLGEPEVLVAQVEAGDASPSEGYIRRVLTACELPEDWPGSEFC